MKPTAHQLLLSANAVMRSAAAIVSREGKETNWKSFSGNLHRELKKQHAYMFPKTQTK